MRYLKTILGFHTIQSSQLHFRCVIPNIKYQNKIFNIQKHNKFNLKVVFMHPLNLMKWGIKKKVVFQISI